MTPHAEIMEFFFQCMSTKNGLSFVERQCLENWDEVGAEVLAALDALADENPSTPVPVVAHKIPAVDWQAKAAESKAISARWGVSDEYQKSQPYHNDLYPY